MKCSRTSGGGWIPRLTTEDCYYSALIALLGSIRHGTTTLIDHHASPRAVAGSLGAIERAVRETGLRACLCYELSDRDGARIAKEGLAENAWFIQRAGSRTTPHVKRLFGLHAVVHDFRRHDGKGRRPRPRAAHRAFTSTSPRRRAIRIGRCGTAANAWSNG